MNIFLIITILYILWKVDIICGKLHQHIEKYNADEVEKKREVEEFDEDDF